MEKENLKWEASVSARIGSASAEQIWGLVKDFFGVQNYFPIITSSYGIHGNNGEVGSIRYCEGVEESSPRTEAGNPVRRWSKEKITAVDPTQRCLSYEVIDSSTGFNSYVSTMKVIQSEAESESSCVLEWSFSVDPVEGFQFDQLLKLYQIWVELVANKMEAAAIPSSN